MIFVIQRQPKPDARVWPGRTVVAAVDAVAFPALSIVAIVKAPFATGVIGIVGIALAVVVGAARLWRAVFRNERYWFTTWRWGRVVLGFVLVGMAVKLVLSLAH